MIKNLLITSMGFNVWFAANLQLINGTLQTLVLIVTFAGLVLNIVKQFRSIKKGG